MKKTLIINVTEAGASIAELLSKEFEGSTIVRNSNLSKENLEEYDNIIFIGSMGICVRSLLPHITNKYKDPAVVCVDSSGRYAISVLSGHIGGANMLCKRVASVIGAEAVITTQSDSMGIWTLDTMAQGYGWSTSASKALMNRAIFALVNGKRIGLLLEIKDSGTAVLERTKPANVSIVKSLDRAEEFDFMIAVTPFLHECSVPLLTFCPKVLEMGVGCRKDCDPTGIPAYIGESLVAKGVNPAAIRSISTVELKRDEALLKELKRSLGTEIVNIWSADQLKDIEVPNPSEKVHEVTGAWGISESSAIMAAHGGPLVVEKQKGALSEKNDFTFAVAMDRNAVRGGHIEIVGAGPGDPELVSVRGKRFLSKADLILYAGSLVPYELTLYAKKGCVVRSSATMNLEEQFELMKEFYDRDLLVVRLHTGDPCIYGAIQEQMAFFDKYNMSYHITPGISSFQAAAAALRSQFTIPERVQTIILTRGEGRTPMPEREKLHKLAASQSTMCIYLSAAIVEEVQRELLEAYPPETPVAACYKLTWKQERIYRGVLRDLAKIVRENNLTLTTLLVVGDAIDNRAGLSRLYDDSFKHLFRK